MDIDPKTYPSRMFARFTARNQLMADVTGQTILSAVKRLGGATYMQQAIPDGDSPSISTDSSPRSGGFRMGFSMNPSSAEDTTPRVRGENQDSQLPLGALSALESEGDDCPSNGIDEALFEEIVRTTISPNRYPELYQSCGTQKAAAEVETRVAAEIVAAYRTIKRKQACLIVQSLNNLL